jgi:hypothetical protein
MANDDAFIVYLRSINGRILRPVDPSPVIDAEYEVNPPPNRMEVAPPPRPIANE